MDIIFFLSQIDRLRKERKLTKAEFYERADITASAVSQWRNEKTVPAETTIQRIADLFGVEVSFLTGEQKIPPPFLRTVKLKSCLFLSPYRLIGAPNCLNWLVSI